LLGGGEPEEARGFGGGALVVGDALEPVAADEIIRWEKGEELPVQGAKVGGRFDEGFAERVRTKPVGEGFGGCGDAFGVGEVELRDADEFRSG